MQLRWNLAERLHGVIVLQALYKITKSSTDASKWASGTDPGMHISMSRERRAIPSKTGFVATSFRSLNTTNSDSLDDSPISTELRLLKSKTRSVCK